MRKYTLQVENIVGQAELVVRMEGVFQCYYLDHEYKYLKVLVSASHLILVPNSQNGQGEWDFINGVNVLEAKHRGIHWLVPSSGSWKSWFLKWVIAPDV